MPASHFPNGFRNGVHIKNVPVLNSHPGSVFWVHSGSGSDGNDGTFERPFATIDYAIGRCTASKGDLILVKAGHAEALVASGAITCDVAGVTIFGLGTGNNRPVLTCTPAAAGTNNIAISAANVSIGNIVATPGLDALTNPFNVSAANVSLDIEWQDASSTIEAETVILTTAAADNLSVNLKYNGFTAGNACVAPIKLVGATDARINVDFHGVASTAIVNFITTLSTNVRVTGYVYNSGTTDGSKLVVDTVGSSTWYAEIEDGAAGAKFSGGSGAALASDDITAVNNVLGTVATSAATGAVTSTDTIMAYLKQLVTQNGIELDTDTLGSILMGGSGIATYPAAAAAGNGVSIAEALRYVQDRVTAAMFNRNSTNYLAVTADFTSATWNTVAAHEIATVTGAVHLIILPQVTGTITSAGGTATLILGDETTTNSIIASTDAENLAVGEWWFDTTDTRTLAARSVFEKTDVVVGNGKDIGYTVGTEALTGGSIVFHMWWEPIDATGAVAAGAGGVL